MNRFKSMADWLTVLTTVFAASSSHVAHAASLDFELLWRYRASGESCEIAAFSPETNRLFVTAGGGVHVVSPISGNQVAEIASLPGFHSTSVACDDNVVAVAWAADDKHERGKVVFYDAETLTEIASHTVGFLPDMIVFTPDGNTLLAASEGEPTDDYSFDPEGSVSLISRNGLWKDAQASEATFARFNSQRNELISQGVHLFGPGGDSKTTATVAEDVEPEYIAVQADSKTAWITLQENNAIAELDIDTGEITAIHPLGWQNFRSLDPVGQARLASYSSTTGLDVSDRDGGARIRHWPVWGMYQPDGIATFQHNGQQYLVTANEGDPRDYKGFEEASRVAKLENHLDRSNPARYLTGDDQLGRLEVSRFAGDSNRDGKLDQLVCFGTRSFAVWKCEAEGLQLVFDSGSEFEHIIARVAPELFNVDSQPESATDVRSPKRGPEPENIVLFEFHRRRLAAIGLERTGGALIYDISDPESPRFLKYLRPDESGSRDLAPEGMLVIPAEQSATHSPVLILCNEGTGTMTAWEISAGDSK